MRSNLTVSFIKNLFDSTQIDVDVEKDEPFFTPIINDSNNEYSFRGWKQGTQTIYKPGSKINIKSFPGRKFWGVWSYKIIFVSPVFKRKTGSSLWYKDPKDNIMEVSIMNLNSKKYNIPDSKRVKLPPNYVNKGWYAYSYKPSKWVKIDTKNSYTQTINDFPAWGISPLNGSLRVRLLYTEK